jgi:hypothetical protein
MSKTLWHTIQIKVPKEMVELTKSGKVSVKKTLTKTLNISRSNKTPAIKLIPSNENKPQIVNDGKEWDVDILKERMAKARAMKKKNADRNIFEPKEKKMNPVLESKIIKRSRELGDQKKNEFRTKYANRFSLNRRTKKGREEFNKLIEDYGLKNDLQGEQSKYWSRKYQKGYFSYDDALKLIELQKKIHDIDGTQNELYLKGDKFPMRLLSKGSNYSFGYVYENYKNE